MHPRHVGERQAALQRWEEATVRRGEMMKQLRAFMGCLIGELIEGTPSSWRCNMGLEENTRLETAEIWYF